MGASPIFGFYYPDDDTPNDLRLFFLKLAYQVDAEISRQGPLEGRPAAGAQGRMYLATTWRDPYNGNAVKPWNVLYRDDGTKWVQINDSAVQTYRPAWSSGPGAGFTLVLSPSTPANYAEYIVRAAGTCWININQLVQLNGTPQTNSVRCGLPINALTFTGVAGSAQNRPAEVGINNDDDVVEWFSGNYANGQLWEMNSPFWFRATAEYRTG